MFDEFKIAEDDKVYIRLITIRDTDSVLKWRNAPFVVENFIFRELITEEMHEDWIRTQVNEGKVIQFIIGSKTDNTEVGSVYFKDISENLESAEYGIFMDEAASGKGIGYAASVLAIKYMFDEFGLDYINLRVLENNSNAIRMYERLGFKDTNESEEVEVGNEKIVVKFMKLNKKDF